jgi:hypothetical protein
VASAAVLAAAICTAPACTLFDDYLPGTPFTTEQPIMQLSVVGEVNVDRSSGTDECPAGRALFWGLVHNTGDVDVDGVTIIVDAFDAAGAQIGSFSGDVFNGNVETSASGSATAETTIAVDESGTFEICSSLGFDSVARAEGHASGFVIESGGTQ